MKLLVVLGMHRSGTSMVAGMLRAAGWDVGPDELLMPPKPDNPRGFVEHLPAVRINDRVLHRLGGAWVRPPALLDGWERERQLDDLRREAAEVVERLAARDAERVLLKDPRFSLTLPFWQTVADIPTVLLVLRRPGSIVRSLLRREDGMDVDTAARLCLRYVLTALRHDVDHRLVTPGDLLADLDGRLPELTRALGHEADDDELAAARRHVETDLWGRSSGADDDLDSPSLLAAEHLHELLTGPDGNRWADALGRLTTTDELGAAAGRRIEVAATIDEQRERIDDLRATLEEVQARADRLLTERERTRELHDAMRDQRDRAVRQIGVLEDRLRGRGA